MLRAAQDVQRRGVDVAAGWIETHGRPDTEASRKAFYGFDPDFFLQNLARIVDDVVSVFRGALELWPTLVELCHLHGTRHLVPQVRVANRDL
jgi:hypothetical protein